jgi:hypothetical protein
MFRRCFLAVGITCIVLFVLYLWDLGRPGGDGVLASLSLPDGEYMVVQRYNDWREPYSVSFYMRSPGGDWGWCYIDHQASRWRRVSMKHDASSDTVIVTKWGVKRAALDRGRNMFWIAKRKFTREVPAPQGLESPPFSFRGSNFRSGENWTNASNR